MKKTYLQPELEYLEIKNCQIIMSSPTLPVYDHGSGTDDDDDDDEEVSEFEDLLSKPRSPYDLWEN